MTDKEYLNGFLSSLLLAILMVADLYIIRLYEEWNIELIRVFALVFAFAFTLLLQTSRNYFCWFYKKVVFYILFILFAVIAVNVFGTYTLLQLCEKSLWEYIWQGAGDDVGQLRVYIEDLLYVYVAYFAGSIVSVFAVAIYKKQVEKKHVKQLQQRRFMRKS